jgi:hypothetical protein
MPSNELNGRQRGWRGRTRGRAARVAIILTTVAALGSATAAPALASSSSPSHPSAPRYKANSSIDLVAVTPSPGDVAGSGGVFNIDLAAVARNAFGNTWLSAAHGYKPGILSTPPPGIGHPSPFAPGLVVLLSSTPKKAGGPLANLAGVFQLVDVARSGGHNELIADWEVGKAGAFGKGKKVTLIAFLVKGKAPGIVSGSLTLTSTVVVETFTIGR